MDGRGAGSVTRFCFCPWDKLTALARPESRLTLDSKHAGTVLTERGDTIKDVSNGMQYLLLFL